MIEPYRDLSGHSSPDFDFDLLNKTVGHLSGALSGSANLSSEFCPKSMFDHVAEYVFAVAKCDICLIYVFENAGIRLQASLSPRPGLVEQLKPKVEEGAAQWEGGHRQTVVIGQGAYADPRFQRFNEASSNAAIESFLSVPMVGGGKLLGTINLHSFASYQFTQREIDMVGIIAVMLGIKMETDRLKSENDRFNQKMQSRSLVDRAKKILQRDLGICEQTAHRSLQLQSQHRNKRIHEIAEAIIMRDELEQTCRQAQEGASNLRLLSPNDLRDFHCGDSADSKVEFDSPNRNEQTARRR